MSKIIKAIVTDIEGTTSSISFVHEVLFPYAAENLESFVRANIEEPFVAKIIREVIAYGSDGDSYELNACSSPVSALNEKEISHALEVLGHWIQLDMKIKPLKDLQGLIWEDGYKSGAFKGHLYEDAYQTLQEWYKQGTKLYIYSSGSVHAQRLLFGFTEYGDLNYLFSGNFDTKIGPKKSYESYTKISSELNLLPDEILFLSDIEAELDAAKEAGLQTIQLLREGATAAVDHKQVKNFYEIKIFAV
jgi:enolase-phosphatase E1